MEEDRYGRKSRGGAALDVIVVLPASIRNGKNLLFDEGGIVSSSDFIVQLPARSARNSFFTADTAVCNVDSYSKELVVSGADDQDQRTQEDSLLAINHVAVFINNNYIPNLSMEWNPGGNCTFTQGTLRPDPNVLKSLVVKQIITPGENRIRYVYNNSSISAKHVDARLFAWYSTDRLIVSDIDGTVTKSDISGVVDSVIRESYTHIHRGICRFFSDIVNISAIKEKPGKTQASNVRIFYLTSRPLSLLQSTRKFLDSLEQDSCKLPAGPIFCHLGSLSEVLITELWRRNTHEFKSDVIIKQVLTPFQEAGRNPDYRKLFVAAFGNKDLDATAYQMAGVDPNDIYIINKESVISCVGKSISSSWMSFLEKYSPEERSHHEMSIVEASDHTSRSVRSPMSSPRIAEVKVSSLQSNRSLNSSQRISEAKISSSIKQIPKEIASKSRESFQRLKSKVRGHTSSAADDEPDVNFDQRSLDLASVMQDIPTNEQMPAVPTHCPVIRVVSESFGRSTSDSSSTSFTADRVARRILSSSSRRLSTKSSQESFRSYDDPNLKESLHGKLLDLSSMN